MFCKNAMGKQQSELNKSCECISSKLIIWKMTDKAGPSSRKGRTMKAFTSRKDGSIFNNSGNIYIYDRPLQQRAELRRVISCKNQSIMIRTILP